MQLRADALRFVLAQGLPAVIEVTGGSMQPTIAKGTKVHVAALPEADDVAVGDIVLLATTTDVLLLHRVMATFEEGSARFVVHQGDARASTFAIAARHDVLARMTGFAAEVRATPTPDRLDAEARALFSRRCVVCATFVAARRLARALHLSDRGPAPGPVRGLLRRGAQLYRRASRRFVG